ncbi:SH3 domain-containing protein [Formosa sp. A9]|uniref:SH3 domain-containing protein n=1 Tax=Formosa sp. A9 TaxID=3442641 RepID=UPI003EBCD11C
MITEELIKNYFLTEGKTIKAYLLGNEDKLLTTENYDHIKDIFKSNKRDTRRFFYRFNYFIALLILLLILISIPSSLSNIQNFLNFLLCLLIAIPFLIKPLAHLFALKNKRIKKNIYLYKELYGESHFKQMLNIPEISKIENEISSIIPKNKERKDKGVSAGLIAAIVFLILISFLPALVSGMKYKQGYTKAESEKTIEKKSTPENRKQNSNLISSEDRKGERKKDVKPNTSPTTSKEESKIETTSNSDELTAEDLAQLEVEHESDMAEYGEEYMTSKNEEKNDIYATITGTDIVIRNSHSTTSKIIGSFKEAGEKVVVIGTYTSEEQTALIKNDIIVNDSDGEDSILQKGKSVKIIAINEEAPVKILISFKTKEGKLKEGMVPENAIDYINESWYKIKRDNGVVGWVFGKFIKME